MQGLFGTYRVLLAPMAGVSDIALRTLCREQGADMTYTEMVSAKGLSYANEKTRHLLDLAPGEDKVAVQLFGHEPQTMASQAVWIEDALGDALHERGEGAPSLLGGADVEVDQLVGAVAGVLHAHSDGVPDLAEPLEIDTLDDLPVLYIEAGDDAFCDHEAMSCRVIRCS